MLHAVLRIANAIWRERTQLRTSGVGCVGSGRAPYGGPGVAEFCFVLVRGPAGLVAAVLGDPRQHPMPARAQRRIGQIGFGAAPGIDQTEITVEDGDVARRALRQKPAMLTGLASGADGAALRSFQQT